MDEILNHFRQESKDLLEDCEEILEDCEEGDKSEALLEEFSQKIDRIMGSSKSLHTMQPLDSLEKIGKITELGKTLGYNSIALQDHPIFPIIIGFLLDLTEILGEILDNLEDPNVSEKRFEAIIQRLKLLHNKLENNPDIQAEMGQIMSRLGLS